MTVKIFTREYAWGASYLDTWLRGVAARVYAVLPFRFGIIGLDGGDPGDATRILVSGVPDPAMVPAEPQRTVRGQLGLRQLCFAELGPVRVVVELE